MELKRIRKKFMKEYVEKNDPVAHLKPVYFAFGEKKEQGIRESKAWINKMKGILRSEIKFAEPLIILQEAVLKRLNGLIEEEIDGLMLWDEAIIGSYENTVSAYRKLARLNIPIVLWGPKGYAYSEGKAWDHRGFLGSEGAEVYAPLGISEYNEVLRLIGIIRKLGNTKALFFGAIPNIHVLSTCLDFGLVKRRIGMEVKQVSMDTLFEEMDKIKPEESRKVINSWKKDIEKMEGPNEEEVQEVARIYLAFKKIIKQEDANSLTINCLHQLILSKKRFVAPCFAMAKLIDEGVISGCEGDLNALLSMLILHYISGHLPIMGNLYLFRPHVGTSEDPFAKPSFNEIILDVKQSIDSNIVRLTHDVIPLSMCDTKYTLRDYHGLRKGVTAYAHLKEGETVTLARLSADLTKLLVIKGYLEKCDDSIHCRFSAWIKIKDVTALARNAFSYHHAMVYGDQTQLLERLGEKLKIEVIVI